MLDYVEITSRERLTSVDAGDGGKDEGREVENDDRRDREVDGRRTTHVLCDVEPVALDDVVQPHDEDRQADAHGRLEYLALLLVGSGLQGGADAGDLLEMPGDAVRGEVNE